jgi:ribosomal protein S15
VHDAHLQGANIPRRQGYITLLLAHPHARLSTCKPAHYFLTPRTSLILPATVARLTTRISQLAEHMRIHKKDYASRRGLEAVIAQRRALLQYLRRKDFGAYAQLISRLGLRDTYAKLVSPDTGAA